MAKKRGGIRRIYVRSRGRRYGGRGRGFLRGSLGRVIIGAVSFLGATWLLSKIVPVQYALPASLMGAGGVLYAIDGKTSGEAMLGAGLGSLALPFLTSMAHPATTTGGGFD